MYQGGGHILGGTNFLVHRARKAWVQPICGTINGRATESRYRVSQYVRFSRGRIRLVCGWPFRGWYNPFLQWIYSNRYLLKVCCECSIYLRTNQIGVFVKTFSELNGYLRPHVKVDFFGGTFVVPCQVVFVFVCIWLAAQLKFESKEAIHFLANSDRNKPRLIMNWLQ